MCAVGGDPLEGGSGSIPQVELDINSQQLGKKWGKHRFDYPDISSYSEYEDVIKSIFNDPEKIILDSKNSEYLYIKGENLLRIKLNGEFVSLYPGANTSRVIKAFNEGGLIWEK